jgi:hypothetical protein
MPQTTTDKYPEHLFPAIDPDAEYLFSVVEGQQSGRPYWMLNLSVQDIKRMFYSGPQKLDRDLSSESLEK